MQEGAANSRSGFVHTRVFGAMQGTTHPIHRPKQGAESRIGQVGPEKASHPRFLSLEALRQKVDPRVRK